MQVSEEVYQNASLGSHLVAAGSCSHYLTGHNREQLVWMGWDWSSLNLGPHFLWNSSKAPAQNLWQLCRRTTQKQLLFSVVTTLEVQGRHHTTGSYYFRL